MTFADHFSSVASHYAAYRPGYPPELFDWLATIAPGHGLAWDCACGNGQAARGLTAHFDRIIATDGSEAQIKAAKPHPKIEYRVALAEESGLETHSVDLITVAQAAHWFKHEAFYREVRRVLKPKGVLALWTYVFIKVDDVAVQERIAVFYEKTIAGYWPPGREYVKERYTTLPFPFENEIKHPPFIQNFAWNLNQLMGYLRSWSAVTNFKAARGFDPVEALEKEVKPLWGDANASKPISTPIHMRVARV